MRTESSGRLEFMDALRGIAALCVFASHMLVLLSPRGAYVMRYQFNLGHLGVAVFFLCSGWIIPVSLNRAGNAVFWIRRITRVYPLYWFTSLVWLLVLSIPGLLDPRRLPSCSTTLGMLRSHPISVLLANSLMVQSVTRRPHISAISWTLTVEMLFYVLASLAFLVGLHKRPSRCLLALIAVKLLLLPLPQPEWLQNLQMYLIILWTGTVIHAGANGLESRRITIGLTATVFLLLVAIAVCGTTSDHFNGEAWAEPAAFLVFGAVLALRNVRMPRVLLHLGLISFSLYLVHDLVLAVMRPVGSPFWTVFAYSGVTLAVSELTYRHIEEPGMRFGRRLTQVVSRMPNRPLANPGLVDAAASPN